MKGRFNTPMTEYYVEGENTGEFTTATGPKDTPL